jgi:hypothetical protein
VIEFEPFVAGLVRIGVATGKAPDQAMFEVYFLGLQRHVTADEWDHFTRWAIDPVRWLFFPKLRELQDALREFRGERPLLVEATAAYDRVLEAGTYTPEGGTTWDYRSIRERCGEAAAEAFLAAGGNQAFGNTFRESDRRERFVAAYGEAVRESPDAKLLPAGPVLALPPAVAPPTRAEAVSVIERLQEIADVEPARPKAKPLTDEEWDARVARAKRQAAELLASEPAKAPA